MFMLVNRDFKVVKTCKNDQELLNYICCLKNQENQKAALNSESFPVTWEFMRSHHRFLRIFFANTRQKEFWEMAERCAAHQQDLLMIYKGDQESPLFVSAPSEFSIEQLKLDWVKSYAKEHGLHVITA